MKKTKEEIINYRNYFIAHFLELEQREKIAFIAFNRKHFEHHADAVIQAYFQTPYATWLQEYDTWKKVAPYSSVIQGTEAITLIIKNQPRSFYDVSQTNLIDYPLHPVKLSSPEFLDTLSSIVNEEYYVEDLLLEAQQRIEQFIAPFLPKLNRFTDEEKKFAVKITLYNLLEQYGLFEDNQNLENQVNSQTLTEMEKFQSSPRLLEALNLGNSFARGLNEQILKKWKKILQEEAAQTALKNEVKVKVNINLNPNPNPSQEIQAEKTDEIIINSESEFSEMLDIAYTKLYNSYYEAQKQKRAGTDISGSYDVFDFRTPAGTAQLGWNMIGRRLGTSDDSKVEFWLSSTDHTYNTNPATLPIRSTIMDVWKEFLSEQPFNAIEEVSSTTEENERSIITGNETQSTLISKNLQSDFTATDDSQAILSIKKENDEKELREQQIINAVKQLPQEMLDYLNLNPDNRSEFLITAHSDWQNDDRLTIYDFDIQDKEDQYESTPLFAVDFDTRNLEITNPWLSSSRLKNLDRLLRSALGKEFELEADEKPVVERSAAQNQSPMVERLKADYIKHWRSQNEGTAVKVYLEILAEIARADGLGVDVEMFPSYRTLPQSEQEHLIQLVQAAYDEVGYKTLDNPNGLDWESFQDWREQYVEDRNQQSKKVEIAEEAEQELAVAAQVYQPGSSSAELGHLESRLSDGIFDFIAADSDWFESFGSSFVDIQVSIKEKYQTFTVYRLTDKGGSLPLVKMNLTTGVFNLSGDDFKNEKQTSELLRYIRSELKEAGYLQQMESDKSLPKEAVSDEIKVTSEIRSEIEILKEHPQALDRFYPYLSEMITDANIKILPYKELTLAQQENLRLSLPFFDEKEDTADDKFYYQIGFDYVVYFELSDALLRWYSDEDLASGTIYDEIPNGGILNDLYLKGYPTAYVEGLRSVLQLAERDGRLTTEQITNLGIAVNHHEIHEQVHEKNQASRFFNDYLKFRNREGYEVITTAEGTILSLQIEEKPDRDEVATIVDGKLNVSFNAEFLTSIPDFKEKLEKGWERFNVKRPKIQPPVLTMHNTFSSPAYDFLAESHDDVVLNAENMPRLIRDAAHARTLGEDEQIQLSFFVDNKRYDTFFTDERDIQFYRTLAELGDIELNVEFDFNDDKTVNNKDENEEEVQAELTPSTFLETLKEDFQLSDEFEILEDNQVLRLVKQHFWGMETLITAENNEFELSSASDGISGVKDFRAKFEIFRTEYEQKLNQNIPTSISHEVNPNPNQTESTNVPIDEPLDLFSFATADSSDNDAANQLNKPISSQEASLEKLKASYLNALSILDYHKMMDSGQIFYDQEYLQYYEYAANQLLQADNHTEINEPYVFEWLNKNDKQEIESIIQSAYKKHGYLALTFDQWKEEFNTENQEKVDQDKASQHKNSSKNKQSDDIEVSTSHKVTVPSEVQTDSASKKERLDFSFPENLVTFYPGTVQAKIEGNIAALRLINILNSEIRLATAEEQTILAHYVGWGGRGVVDVFDENNPKYATYREELKQLISEKDYQAIRRSALTAYYTSPEIIKAIYASLSELGFKEGRILDPSMGTGNFFSAMPKELKKNSELFGVEIDPMTATIAKQLQQTVSIQEKGFEDTRFANNSMDVVITNVPFSDKIHPSDTHYNRPYVIHDYFIKKALDLVHDGGIVAVITSKGTMDKRDSRFREELAQQAHLLKAVRLPDTAFSKIAGTAVTSDILIFQKDSSLQFSNHRPEWLETVPLADGKGNKIYYNCYFERHPEQVLGDFKIETYNGGTLSIKATVAAEDLAQEVQTALHFEEGEHFESAANDRPLYELEEKSETNVPEQVLKQIVPYTIMIFEGKPYYHNGEFVELMQKTSSVTLNINETRQNQLTRYKNNKERIYKEEANKKTNDYLVEVVDKSLFSDNPEFDSLDLSQKEIEHLIEHSTLDKGNESYQLISTDKRNIALLKQSVALSTKYSYHFDYSKDEVKAMSKMIELRYTLQDLLALQHKADYSTTEYEALRLQLNEQYDTFIKDFGPLSNQKNSLLMRQDDYYQFLASIELDVEDEITKQPKKAKSAVFLNLQFSHNIQSLRLKMQRMHFLPL
ncbi:Eco57I restriction-modification methylase domain-containing protein [Lactococcus nasutitermitis]|uniref:Eco57I restriction-modification methylase domain-containing protein n=1 Tax=Lactococcus nasutitermitis TaxID=1652957 RepID=A0ABV9JD35_9LACT|nr:hypothetical protein [Lactococcus nasutitermitis]